MSGILVPVVLLQLSRSLAAGQVLWAAHAGDSRAVLCRDGTSLCMTQDHKPELKFERARVEENGGKVEFQRYSLTHACRKCRPCQVTNCFWTALAELLVLLQGLEGDLSSRR